MERRLFLHLGFLNLGFPSLVFLTLNACVGEPVNALSGSDDGRWGDLESMGRVEETMLDEISGLALSPRDPNLIWMHNDGRKPRLYGASLEGAKQGRITVQNSDGSPHVANDWEDLDAFRDGEQAYLLIAATGDNDEDKGRYALHIIEEPVVEGESFELTVPIAWSVEFGYPSGKSFDCEAVAVLEAEQRVLLLPKKPFPQGFYWVPLRPDRDDIIARPLENEAGAVTLSHLPLAHRHNVTGLALSSDGHRGAVLTKRELLLFDRKEEETWADAFARRPSILKVPKDVLPQPESVCFFDDDDSVLVSTETKRKAPGKQAPLLRTKRVPAR